MKIRIASVLGTILLLGTAAFAQDYPKVETSPAFMFIHTPVSFTVPLTSPVDPERALARPSTALVAGARSPTILAARSASRQTWVGASMLVILFPP